jgi:hypothetical protein
MIAENVIIEDSPSFEISDYVFRCAESLGIGRLGGYIKVSFADDIGVFSGEADGTEDRVNVGYADQPWEEEAYRYEEEIYQTIESGGKECSEVQSAIYPHRS